LSELRHDRTRNFTGGDFFSPQLQFGILNVRQEIGAGFSLKVNAFGRHFKVEQFNASLIDDNTRGFTDTTSAGGTLSLGATFVSQQFLRGDEENVETPLDSYFVLRGGSAPGGGSLAPSSGSTTS
jgi:hypothetical protein